MTGIEAIRTSLRSTQHLVTWFLGDLSDADLLVRPLDGANHIAWQLGHLVLAERRMISAEMPHAGFPDLPAGFAERHTKDAAALDPPAGFADKATYLGVFTQTRETTVAALGTLTDADLDRPNTGPMAAIAPTLGAVFLLAANHALMHAGQFSVVRRKLGKPILF
jgi:DinB superfamily